MSAVIGCQARILPSRHSQMGGASRGAAAGMLKSEFSGTVVVRVTPS